MIYYPFDIQGNAGAGYIPPEKPLEWALQYPTYPVASFELPTLLRWYPVGFTEKNGVFSVAMPVAAEPEKSVLINSETGKWIGKTIPLFIRKYPFSLHYEDVGEGNVKRSLLIADGAQEHLSFDTPRKILDDEGNPTRLCTNMIKRMARYDSCRTRDTNICRLLKSLDVFVPWELNMGPKDNPTVMLNWFRIDEKRLMDLPGDIVQKLHEHKAWRLIYGHLYSVTCSEAPGRFATLLQKRKTARLEATSSEHLDDDAGLIEF